MRPARGHAIELADARHGAIRAEAVERAAKAISRYSDDQWARWRDGLDGLRHQDTAGTALDAGVQVVLADLEKLIGERCGTGSEARHLVKAVLESWQQQQRPLPESASAVCKETGTCFWTASGPWSKQAGDAHQAETGHDYWLHSGRS